MKKVITFLTILSMVGLLFAAEKYSKKEQGTYIPFAMYETLSSEKSYGKAIEATSEKDIYTVLCVTENKILSNIKFHDAFSLNDADVDFQFSSKTLIDNKTGEKYIKISDSTDYYAAYNDFLLKTVVKNLAKKNPLSLLMEKFGKSIKTNGTTQTIFKSFCIASHQIIILDFQTINLIH